MLHNVLLSLIALTFCLSLFLVHRASILGNDFQRLQGDIILQLNHPRSEGVQWKMAKMSKTKEDLKHRPFQNVQSSLKISFKRMRREQDSCRAPTSFLQLTANPNTQPVSRGNISVIPWTVSVQQGNTISTKENRIVVQVDGYYFVFGQVWFVNPHTVMGYVIQKLSPATPVTKSTQILRCMKEWPDQVELKDQNKGVEYSCYTSGIVHLHQDNELQLVIPNRPQLLISMNADTTFFGVIHVD